MSFSTAGGTDALEDSEIIARSRREPELFSIIVKRYEAPFLRRAQRILLHREDAEDAVQDAFTKMYLYADTFRSKEGASFSSWAFTILNHVAYTKYRAVRSNWNAEVTLEPEHYESLPDVGAEFLEDLSVKNEVVAVLSKLPETAARILSLQFLDGRNQEEIAESEQLSIPAVKTRVHRAKKLFKQEYDKQH